MIVKCINGTDWNDCAKLVMKVNGEKVLRISCLSECPEDASLERDLNFVYDIPDLMKRAWEAGKNGEPFEVIDEDMEEE